MNTKIRTHLVTPLLGLTFLASAALAQTTSYDILATANASSGGNLFVAGTAASGSGGTFTTSSSDLVFTSGSSSGGQAYFVATLASGSEPSLSLVNVGDTITLSFTVTGYNISAQSQEIRFGIYDVGDNFSSSFSSSTTFGSETGYSASYGNTGNAANGIYQRTGTSTSLLNGATELNASGANFALASRAYGSSGWGGSTGYTTTGSLVLTLLDDGQVSITASIGGAGLSGAQTYTSTTSLTSFNAIAFSVAGLTTAAPELDFSNLTLTYTSAIPEPKTAGLILGAGALAGICVWRSRRKRDLP